MVRFFLGFVFLSVSNFCLAGSAEFTCAPGWRFENNSIKAVQYLSVIDGDTFKIKISGIPAIFGESISVRIADIDAAEHDGKGACERDMALAMTVRLDKLLATAETIDLLDVKRDKYFRLLARVRINGAVDIGAFFLENKWVSQYSGGTKVSRDWCRILKTLR